MAANPITFEQIEAFERKAGFNFSAWEVAMLERLDDAVLAVWADQSPKPKIKAKGAERGEIPVSHPKGIRAMLQGIAARKKAQAGAR